ncbi:hypothetical protein P7C70_g1811, partial [Phenoliferia sp. Uapishka_3]
MSDDTKTPYHDEEKFPGALANHPLGGKHQENGTAVLVADDGVNRERGIIGTMWKVVTWLDSFGVEVRGIERVPPDARHHTSIADAMWLWMSANFTISTFSLGSLGPVRKLSLIGPYCLLKVIFIIMLGEGAQYMTSAPLQSGPVEAANVLSFGAAIAGFALGWTSLAADYTVNFPVEASSTSVFIYTYIGLNIPLIFVEILGAAMMTTFGAKPSWGALYDENGLGGLLFAPLSPMEGFGRFLLVILALSIVANNIPNMYSFALTFQAFGKLAQQIPRIFLVCFGTVIYIILAIVGADHFESWLDTLLVILSYWLAIYTVILCWEHFYFRRGKWSNYNLDAYNTPSLLPVGYAAAGACAFGIMGAVLGMAQTWYVGVIGKKIGLPEYGGDIGFELSGSFSFITYPIFRTLERRYTGR